MVVKDWNNLPFEKVKMFTARDQRYVVSELKKKSYIFIKSAQIIIYASASQCCIKFANNSSGAEGGGTTSNLPAKNTLLDIKSCIYALKFLHKMIIFFNLSSFYSTISYWNSKLQNYWGYFWIIYICTLKLSIRGSQHTSEIVCHVIPLPSTPVLRLFPCLQICIFLQSK